MSSLCSPLSPCCCLWSVLHQGSCLVPWSYCTWPWGRGHVLSMVCVTTKGQEDVCGWCCGLRPCSSLWNGLPPGLILVVHEACCSESHVACDVIGLCAVKCSHDVCSPCCQKGSCWCLWSILWPEMMLRSSTDCKDKEATFIVVSMIEESHLRKRNIVFCENFFAYPISTPNNVIT